GPRLRKKRLGWPCWPRRRTSRLPLPAVSATAAPLPMLRSIIDIIGLPAAGVTPYAPRYVIPTWAATFWHSPGAAAALGGLSTPLAITAATVSTAATSNTAAVAIRRPRRSGVTVVGAFSRQALGRVRPPPAPG